MRGPKDAYASKLKQQYRERVWKSLTDNGRLISSESKALILPGPTSAEIDLLIALGIKEHNIYAVDENMDKNDYLPMFPSINAFSGQLHDAAEQFLPQDIAFANLDFCSCISASIISTLKKIGELKCLRMARVSMNLLRGRESKETFSTLSIVSAALDTGEKLPSRLEIAFYSLFGRDFRVIKRGTYKASSPMVWATVEPHDKPAPYFLRKSISKKTANALSIRRESGQTYGHAPFGWRIEDGKLLPDEKSQSVLHCITKMRKNGASYRKICGYLNSAGISTPQGGKQWWAASVRKVLSSRAYIKGVGD